MGWGKEAGSSLVLGYRCVTKTCNLSSFARTQTQVSAGGWKGDGDRLPSDDVSH